MPYIYDEGCKDVVILIVPFNKCLSCKQHKQLRLKVTKAGMDLYQHQC